MGEADMRGTVLGVDAHDAKVRLRLHDEGAVWEYDFPLRAVCISREFQALEVGTLFEWEVGEDGIYQLTPLARPGTVAGSPGGSAPVSRWAWV